MATITKSVKHHVSMGNYEWVEIGAEVTVSDESVSYDELITHADELLAEAVEADLKQAHMLTDEQKSYVHIHPVNATPRKARR